MKTPRYSLPLTPEQLEARKSMPLDHSGAIVSLQCTVDKRVAAYEAKWREWAKTVPKHLYPDWFDQWPEIKRQRGLT